MPAINTKFDVIIVGGWCSRPCPQRFASALLAQDRGACKNAGRTAFQLLGTGRYLGSAGTG